MDLENCVLDLIIKNPNGVTNKMLQTANPSTGVAQLVEVINKLTAADKIQIFHKGKQLVYMLKNPDSAKHCKGADIEEKLIYQHIEKAGNKGIWVRDLRFASNIPQTQVNKILKTLESKKLIKSVTSVAASKKKVYMLYNIEPDRSVTGGTWYSDQEFESEFVDVLNQQCYRYLLQTKAVADKLSDPVSRRRASFKSSKDICDYINGLKVQLSKQDIETILDTLVFDGKVEKSSICSSSVSNEEESENIYGVIKPLISDCGLMRVPCGVCPVHNECRDGGIISPTTCPYMKEWLEY
ncbi:DNA-directed RNA polymerase III subunit RPC6 [Trichonephila inaurata madagascariensis]|uniref:DNA-directed RNA polymerase III subunit RPC6 n=1 Tax=Trichonephila inaurata madagascariensis TaxID=2747483 RepID=A0A8X6X4Y2_9ARAC|nr:DNA-directed RNA polymerase III subunit RPC6 [Trichonephila inaurata madagascariensis]